MKLYSFVPVKIGYSRYEGLEVELLGMCLILDTHIYDDTDGALFRFAVHKRWRTFDILWIGLIRGWLKWRRER